MGLTRTADSFPPHTRPHTSGSTLLQSGVLPGALVSLGGDVSEAVVVTYGREYLSVEFFYLAKNRQEKFESTTWRLNEKVRYMVFFYHDERTRQITTHLL